MSSNVPDISEYIGDYMPYETVSRKQGGMMYRAYKDGKLPNTTDAQINMMYGRYVRDQYETRL